MCITRGCGATSYTRLTSKSAVKRSTKRRSLLESSTASIERKTGVFHADDGGAGCVTAQRTADDAVQCGHRGVLNVYFVIHSLSFSPLVAMRFGVGPLVGVGMNSLSASVRPD